MKVIHLRIFSVAAVLTALISVPAVAQPEGMVVASDGVIMKLQNGSYGVLFPDGVEVDPESSVLALDILRLGGRERLLVPATEDSFVEKPATVYHERESDLTYLLWEGLYNGVHPLLYLTSYGPSQWAQWAEPILITGNVFAEKSSPQLVIMPESDLKPKAALAAESPTQRTVIYVAWKEEGGIGGQKYLVPVILEDGQYLGWHQSFNLSDFLKDDLFGLPIGSPDPDLEDLFQMQSSVKGHSVVVGFIDFSSGQSGQLITLEVEMIPLALSALADRVMDLVAQSGGASINIPELLSQVRPAIMSEGADFHRSILEYLADQLEALLGQYATVEAAVAPESLEKIGAMLIDVGSRVRRKGMIDLEPLEIVTFGQTSSSGGPFHHMKVSLLARREVPLVGGPATLFLSRAGDEAAVAWVEESAVYYRETEGESWGVEQVVEIQEGLDRDAVYRILADRTLNR